MVIKDVLFSRSVTPFEETLYDANPSEDLHVLLSTPGGDGETALRLIRQAQSRCKELTVVVPDQAKSARPHAAGLGLPVDEAAPGDPRRQTIWRLWAKYVAIDAEFIYEGQTASHVKFSSLHNTHNTDLTCPPITQSTSVIRLPLSTNLY